MDVRASRWEVRAVFRWDVKPKRMLYVLLSPFVDMARVHSDVMQKGFQALNNFIATKQEAAAGEAHYSRSEFHLCRRTGGQFWKPAPARKLFIRLRRE